MSDFYSDDLSNSRLEAAIRDGDQKARDTLSMRAERGGVKAKRLLEKLTDEGIMRVTKPARSPIEPLKVRRPAVLTNLPSLYLWQEEAMNAWERNGRRGIIQAVTGAGKTVLGLAAAHRELSQGGKVAVVVPSIVLQNQWIEKLHYAFPNKQIGKLGGGGSASLHDCDILVAVANSARQKFMHDGGNGGLLIADECHRYGSETNSLALETEFPHRLGLSATYERSDDGHIEILVPYFGPVCFTLDYRRAIKDGVISEFNVIFLGIDLSDEEYDIYQEHSEKASRLRGKLINAHGVSAEPFGTFMKEVQTLSEGGGGEATGLARRYLDSFSKKRQILADADQKIEAMNSLGELIKLSKRALIFTQQIEPAIRIERNLANLNIRVRAMHSQQKAQERAKILNDFRDGKLHAIIAPQILDEGVDVPDADIAFVVSAASTKRQMIQRMGRVLRKSDGKNVATFYILYAKGTTEDPALGAQEGFIEEIRGVARDESFFELGGYLADAESSESKYVFGKLLVLQILQGNKL